MNTPFRSPALLLTCGLALAALPAAFAATHNDNADNQDLSAKFRKLDTDNDGRLSSAEYTAQKAEKKHWWNFGSKSATDQVATPEMFQQLDTNHDGFLSETEMAASTGGMTPSSTSTSGAGSASSGSTSGSSGTTTPSSSSQGSSSTTSGSSAGSGSSTGSGRTSDSSRP